MTIGIPPLWATNDNYSSGPDSGTPTKVDPSSDANGFIRGTIAAPQHINFLIGLLASGSRALLPGVALSMRSIATSITNTRALALASSASIANVIAFPLNEARSLRPAEGTTVILGDTGGSLFRGVAADNASLLGRIAGVSNASAPLHYSDDGGVTWTFVAAADCFGANPGLDIAHNNTLWMAICEASTNAIFSSPTAEASDWTSRSLGGTAGDAPKRLCSSRTTGRSLCLGNNAGVTAMFMAESANGITWSPVTLPGTADDVGGSLAWHPDGFFLWAQKVLAGGGMKLYRSSDVGSASWTLVFQSVRPMTEVSIDQITGAVYLAGGGRVGVSFDQGASFHRVRSDITSVAAVNGLVLGLDTTTDILYASSAQLVSHP